MDACLDSHWLLALNGFTIHDSLTSNAQITFLEFSLILVFLRDLKILKKSLILLKLVVLRGIFVNKIFLPLKIGLYKRFSLMSHLTF